MGLRAITVACLMLAAGLLTGGVATADEADAFFAADTVHEIRLSFDDPGWFDTLYANHAQNPEDPYVPAHFVCGEVELDPVGVRFKGNSSFRMQGMKKSFKIDFNEYDEGVDGAEDTVFFGLKKLNLNNSFKDPTMLREKLFLDFAGRYLPAIRAVHVRLFVNDTYWGLYTAVEQIDKTFLASSFSDNDDGNLYEGEASGVGDPRSVFGSDLTYLGPDPAPYAGYYQLKTNEEENDYSRLIEMIDILNNTPPQQLPELIEPVLDVPAVLAGLALNLLFVNLDSYCGSAHNYYLYDGGDGGRFTHLHWDTNETFGSFRMGVAPGQDLLTLPPLWLPTGGGPGAPSSARPLMENLWAVDSYRILYLRLLARMLREGFNAVDMQPRIEQLAEAIREDVYSDPHAPYPSAEFERALYQDLRTGNSFTYGLLSFVEARSQWLGRQLDTFARITDLRLNEVMPLNLSTVADRHGDYDPWLEIYNLGPGRVAVRDLFLSDDEAQLGKWALADGHLDDGRFLVVWADGEDDEGPDHAGFRLDANGGQVLLSQGDGNGGYTLIDSVTYPAMVAGRSYVRLSELDPTWSGTDRPTLAAANLPAGRSGVVVINEVMADNETTIEDPDEPGAFDDWLELYNPGGEAVDLGGMYLTDDLAEPARWQVPSGTVLAAGGYLLLWADNDPEQGALHAGFKLSAGGEEVGLFAADGVTEIDAVVFGAQQPDVSYGRFPDGSGRLVAMASPTPGAANRDDAPAPRRSSGRVQ